MQRICCLFQARRDLALMRCQFSKGFPGLHLLFLKCGSSHPNGMMMYHMLATQL